MRASEERSRESLSNAACAAQARNRSYAASGAVAWPLPAEVQANVVTATEEELASTFDLTSPPASDDGSGFF